MLQAHHARDLHHRYRRGARGVPDVQIRRWPVGLRGHLLALFRFFEREFRALADQFGAQDQHYPVMVPRDILEDVGYFSHFHSTSRSACICRGICLLLEAVATSGRLETLAEPAHVPTPAVCLPCYKQQRGTSARARPGPHADDAESRLPLRGHELSSVEPRWDFTVRDIVFFGSSDDLVRLRSDVMERAMALCRELDLEVTIELANDPIFLDASRDKAIYQRMGEVKFELLFPLPYRQESLAASSFNLHRDFYTSIYDVRFEDGTRSESACMGFGFERWLYGFLSQTGLDPAGWPARVTQE